MKIHFGMRRIRHLEHSMGSQKFIAGAPGGGDKKITKIHNTHKGKYCVELFPYALEWIFDPKAKGYDVYIFSNYGENTPNHTEDKLKLPPLMVWVVFSYKV